MATKKKRAVLSAPMPSLVFGRPVAAPKPQKPATDFSTRYPDLLRPGAIARPNLPPRTGWATYVPPGLRPGTVKAPANASTVATAAPGGFAGDSAYAAAIARLQFTRDNQLAQLAQSATFDQADLTKAIGRVREQQPEAEQAAKEAANRQGLFYSGELGKQLGDINTAVTRQTGDLQDAYARREAERQLGRQALEGGLAVDSASALADAISRQIERDAQSAATGGLPTPGNSGRPVSGAGRSPAARPAVVVGRDSKGRLGEWHIYPDGRKVFVVKKR